MGLVFSPSQVVALIPKQDMLSTYVCLFKDFHRAGNSFMTKNMLTKIEECLVDQSFTLKQAKAFYKTELKGYIKLK